jgi:hypothetical protein
VTGRGPHARKLFHRLPAQRAWGHGCWCVRPARSGRLPNRRPDHVESYRARRGLRRVHDDEAAEMARVTRGGGALACGLVTLQAGLAGPPAAD